MIADAYAATVSPVTPQELEVLELVSRLSKKIADAREEKFPGKQEPAAKALGIKGPYLSRLENAKGIPSPDLVERMRDVFDIDPAPLLRILAEIELAKVDARLRGALDARPQASIAEATGGRAEGLLPVYGLASCGAAVEAIRNDKSPTGEERVTAPWPEAVGVSKSKRAFVVLAEGDSMAPTIADGDELLVDPRAKLSDGDIALVQWEGDATVKRYREVGGTILLTPDNPDRKKFQERKIAKGLFSKGNGVAWRVVLKRNTTRL